MGILGELWVKLGLKSEGLTQGLQDAKKETNSFASGLKSLGKTLGSVFAVQQVTAFAKECASLAGQAKGVRRAFERIADASLLNDLRRATQGTVDDLQLMQRAVQAHNFKIPLDNLASYLAFATKRAQETGLSVDYLVDSIVTGLGRQSILILDNLGISAAEIRSKMEETGSMADAVGEIIRESMSNSTTEVDKAVVATQTLAAAWTNFKIALGNSGLNTIFASIQSSIAGVLERTTAILNSNNLNNWQKWAATHPLLGAILKLAGTTDRAIAQDKIDAEEYGPPVPKGLKSNIIEPVEEKKEEKEAVSGLVNLLKEEIKTKEQIRDLSDNTEEITSLNNEVAKLKERLSILQMTSEEYAQWRQEQMGEPLVDSVFDLDALEDNITKGKKLLDGVAASWLPTVEQLSDETTAQQEALNQAAGMMTAALSAGVSGSLNELANAIAGIQGSNIGTVMAALLGPLADSCISAGLLVIGLGEAVEAFKIALESLNGWAAIAAGAALVAIGVATKAGLASIASSGGSGTVGYGSGSVTSFSGGYGSWGGGMNMQNQAQEINLTGVLQGSDIYLSVKRTEENNRR